MEKTELIKELIRELGDEEIIRQICNELLEERNKRKIDVSKIKLGDKITIEDENGKEKWTAIAHQDGGIVFLLDKEYQIKSRFGDNNDYRRSYARKKASSCDQAQRVLSVLGKDALVPIKIDLFSHDGLRDYGVCEGDLFGCLTYDMYRNNRQYIEPNYFWTATPDSTPSGGRTSYVQCVNTDGRVFCNGCDWNDVGVRPFFILKSSTCVSCEQ